MKSQLHSWCDILYAEMQSKCVVLDKLEHENHTLLSRINRFEDFLNTLENDQTRRPETTVLNRTLLYPNKKLGSDYLTDGFTKHLGGTRTNFPPSEELLASGKLDREAELCSVRLRQSNSLNPPLDTERIMANHTSPREGACSWRSSSNSSVKISVELKQNRYHDTSEASTHRSEVDVCFSNLAPERTSTKERSSAFSAQSSKRCDEAHQTQNDDLANSFDSLDIPIQISTPKASKLRMDDPIKMTQMKQKVLGSERSNGTVTPSENLNAEAIRQSNDERQQFDRPISPIDCRSPSLTPRPEAERRHLESSFETIYDSFRLRSNNGSTMRSNFSIPRNEQTLFL